jgi:uncharacterized repeat protein (TIGR01451 family)
MKQANSCARLAFGVVISLMVTSPFFGSAADPMMASGTDAVRPEDCLPKDPPPPVVKIKVRVPACGEPGQPIEYRICVENCSTSEAHHVIVKNALPANAKFIKADPEPSKQGPELQWNLGTVGGGAVREIVMVLQPTNKEDVKNCARVQFEHGQCVVTRQAHRPPFMPGAPGDRPPIIDVIPDADRPVLDLAIEGPQQQFANLPAKYFFTLTNKGKTKAMNAYVSARLPDTLRVDKVGAPGLAAENMVAWILGHLEPGASKTFELSLRTTAKGRQCFKASAKADGVPEKTWDVCTNFVGASAMAVEMFGRDGVVFVGKKTSYPITIISQGSEPLTNIRVQAFIPDGLKLDKTTPPLTEKREAAKDGELIEFKVLPKIDGGAKVTYEIFVQAVRPGVTRFHVSVLADQLESGPVVEQEITNVVDDLPQVKEIR